MKSSDTTPQGTDRSPGGALSIIYGGGWKNPPTEERLKVKAFAGVFLTIGAASGGVHFYQDYGLWVFAPSLILFVATGLLFCFERPTTLCGPQDGSHDIRNLYARGPDTLKTNRKDQHEDTNGA